MNTANLDIGSIVVGIFTLALLVYFLVCYFWALLMGICWIHDMLAGIRVKFLSQKEK